MLVHRYISHSSASFLQFQSFLTTCILLFIAIQSQTLLVRAQQIPTNGLSILDSPQPGTPFNAGSNQEIAIEISGNGILQSLQAAIDTLEIYLTSRAFDLNMTVAGPAEEIMAQEPGSTVKHVRWQVPSCLSPGTDYELIFYEGSHSADKSFFAITTLGIVINNNNRLGNCSNDPTVSVQQLLGEPQDSSPPDQALMDAIRLPSAGQPGMVTITMPQGSSMPSPFVPPVTSNLPPTMTVVLVSTVISTQNGGPTTTFPSTTTMTMSRDGNARFIPINAARIVSPSFGLNFIWTIVFFTVAKLFS
ncbi:hypothetical protein HGRIS_007746 [Hohenbuehelia grisea]|uniref:Uncharacterized protein n=1 Tax=Hohenbuehelia grisea TaxID=104357 RepID=A0ABR3J5T0_9AGAR